MRSPRPLGALALVLALGCSQLKFLKAPSVPRPRGSTSLEPGPALSRAGVDRPDPTADWSTYNRTLEGDRASPLAEIDTANVASLRQTCAFDLHERTPLESGPVVVAGTLYLTTAQRTYAIDAATCALRWAHTYRYRPRPDFDLKVNRGVAYADGRVFRGANDGRVYALDARTGAELWNVAAGDPKKGETFPAAPVAWGGLVFIGNAGGDNFGVTGRMMAFDARTGHRVWSAELVPDAGPAARTWPAGTETVPKGGGTTWTSYALDTLSGSILLATGNAAPDFLDQVRPGTNLHTYSVVELDARLGTLKHAQQMLARDNHDWDLSPAPSLIRTADGRTLILQAGKDGHVALIERDGWRVRWRTQVTTIANVDAPLTAEGTRFCPGVNGGVEWNGPAYDQRAGTVYVNATDWCTTLKLAPPAKLQGKDGLPWTGSAELRHPFGVQDSAWSGWLTAVDAMTGVVRWRYHSPTPMVAGVTPTAGGLVFTGDLAGDLLALDARTGAIRWRYATGRPIGGGVVTYLVAGRQYVAVAAGLHAPKTWRLASPPAQLQVYALP